MDSWGRQNQYFAWGPHMVLSFQGHLKVVFCAIPFLVMKHQDYLWVLHHIQRLIIPSFFCKTYPTLFPEDNKKMIYLCMMIVDSDHAGEKSDLYWKGTVHTLFITHDCHFQSRTQTCQRSFHPKWCHNTRHYDQEWGQGEHWSPCHG